MANTDFFSLDIGKRSVKLAQVERRGDFARLKAIGSIDFPEALQNQLPEKSEKDKIQLLASTIKSLVASSNTGTKQIVTSLPESAIFTKLISDLPIVDETKLEEMIYWEAKQVLPIPIEEAQMDWIKISEGLNAQGQRTLTAMIIAAPRNLVEVYLEIFQIAELEILALEVESVATVRCLKFNYPSESGVVMIIDMGAVGTNVYILNQGVIVFSQSIGNGSNMLTKSIMSDFGLQFAQAEQYKAHFGVLPNQSDGGKIANSLRPILDLMVGEIRKIDGFMQSRLNFGTASKVYLCGNGAMLPGLDQYLRASLSREVYVLDPFQQIKLSGAFRNIRNEIQVSGYTLALGLALKDQ
jgi:type IV pilus assembly protein PilM